MSGAGLEHGASELPAACRDHSATVSPSPPTTFMSTGKGRQLTNWESLLYRKYHFAFSVDWIYILSASLRFCLCVHHLYSVTEFEFLESLPAPSFSFGGQSGNTVTTLVFRAKKS